jgi:mannose-6-phosphate isomerase-like protein (cupin superfamily)
MEQSGADDRDGREYWFDEGCFILELHNSDADPALSIARARVLPGEITHWHQLEGITERYLIESGCGVAEVNGQTAQQVGPGDVVVISPGQHQRIRNTGTTDLIFLALCTPRFVPQAYAETEDVIAASGQHGHGPKP